MGLIGNRKYEQSFLSTMSRPRPKTAPRPARPPPPPPRSVAGPAQARILQAAEEHFLAHGFSRITMDDLAAELGMSKKTLYQHFPSKTGLLNAVLDERLAGIGQETARLAEDTTLDFAGRLNAILRYLSRRMAEIQPPFLFDLKRSAPESYRKIEAFRGQTIPRLFGRLLKEGTRLGWVRRDLDPAVVVELVLSAIQRIVTPDMLIRLNVSAQEAFSTILTVILEGILAGQGRKALAKAKHF